MQLQMEFTFMKGGGPDTTHGRTRKRPNNVDWNASLCKERGAHHYIYRVNHNMLNTSREASTVGSDLSLE